MLLIIIPAVIMNTLLVIFVIGRLFRTRRKRQAKIINLMVGNLNEQIK